MSSSDSMESAQKAILAEVTKQDFALKHVEPPAESFSTTQAKLLLEVQGGKYELNRVKNPPKEGLTEAEKQAYLEEKQQGGN
ncbi:unnamed protein product [Rotaria sordida]|uniref:Uncharacterized protein n=1 Tax=Rotaria sordida TaxID=392033 RepID=A0A814TP02_9BILA|nr:unnamed protein product [Rotaria sordida]CAF0925901.1 unnamed protein product [Rotaria sordida]CAF1162786.1 unnamed protein product [Rotaria sordida]CAF3484436.1 unnamed protein product [Rotaria sordida]